MFYRLLGRERMDLDHLHRSLGRVVLGGLVVSLEHLRHLTHLEQVLGSGLGSVWGSVRVSVLG